MRRFPSTAVQEPLWVLMLPLLVVLAGAGCYDDDDDEDEVIFIGSGIVVADFQSIADYVDNPVVQDIFRFMPRHSGTTPPDVTGRYDASGEIIANLGPVNRVGEAATAEFCLGTPAGSLIDVTVIDPSVQDGGAASFIDGSGDEFTVYTAFKSVRTLDTGSTCEIHVVNIYSARLEADGSLSELFIGQGNVGVIGTCGDALVGDFQVTDGTADRSAQPCPDDSAPGEGPGDPGRVLVEVENVLVTDILVFIDGASTPAIEIGPMSVGSFEAAPGFELDFETLQPIAGQDEDGADLLMGEIFGGLFPPDPAPAGGSTLYTIESQVGVDVYFAPLPLNQTSLEIFSVVNAGVDVPGYPEPVGSGLDCLCAMPPDPDPYVVGYYSYDLPAFMNLPKIIAPEETSVQFFNVANESQLVARFDGPFALEEDEFGRLVGTVVLLVD